MKTTRYSLSALAIMCCLIAFTPLARGSVHLWAVTIMQTGILTSLFLLTIESIHFNTPLIPRMTLSGPLSALIILSLISFVASDNRPISWQGFLLLLTYSFTYFIVVSSVRSRLQQRVVIYTIIGTALFLAVFGLFKRFGLNPFSFWEYDELRYSSTWLSSTYGNHNHLAGFIEMALPFLLVLFLIRTRSLSMIFILSYLVLIMLTVQALTLSRGGWVSTIISTALMGIILLFQKRFQSKKMILAIAGTALLVSIFAIASTPVVERTMTLSEQDESASMEGRINAWRGTLNLIMNFPYLGTGSGTYKTVFTKYQPPGLKVIFNHAHNDYLEAIADIGLPVILVLIWGSYNFIKFRFRDLSHHSRQVRAVSLAVITSFFALLIHSISDFNTHIPANAYLLAVVLGVPEYQQKG